MLRNFGLEDLLGAAEVFLLRGAARTKLADFFIGLAALTDERFALNDLVGVGRKIPVPADRLLLLDVDFFLISSFVRLARETTACRLVFWLEFC